MIGSIGSISFWIEGKKVACSHRPRYDDKGVELNGSQSAQVSVSCCPRMIWEKKLKLEIKYVQVHIDLVHTNAITLLLSHSNFDKR